MAFGGLPVLAASDPLPQVVLVGGEGIPSGVPRHICHLAAAYQRLAKVTVLSDINHGGYDALLDLDVRHVILPGLSTRLSLSHMWQGWRGLLNFLKKSNPDLVWIHARLPSLMGRAALALRLWRPRGATAFTIHGLSYGKGHKPHASAISLAVEKMLMSACPRTNIVFLSQDMADRARTTLGAKRLARHHVHILPNCSDLGDLPPVIRGAAPSLVMTGRAGQQKNYALAARMLVHLPKDYTLILCGSGTETDDFQSSIAAMVPADVRARILCTGPVRDVRPYLRKADAYLLTSRYEGTPIGTLEAFEAGLPIILSNFEGADALVSQHPLGIALDFGNLEDAARRIEQLVTTARNGDDSYRQRARQVWEKEWSPQVFTKRCRALLQNFLNR